MRISDAGAGRLRSVEIMRAPARAAPAEVRHRPPQSRGEAIGRTKDLEAALDRSLPAVARRLPLSGRRQPKVDPNGPTCLPVAYGRGSFDQGLATMSVMRASLAIGRRDSRELPARAGN